MGKELVEYDFTACGWRATGAIIYNEDNKDEFYSLLKITVESVLMGDNNSGIINESYTDGYSRYLRPMEMDEKMQELKDKIK